MSGDDALFAIGLGVAQLRAELADVIKQRDDAEQRANFLQKELDNEVYSSLALQGKLADEKQKTDQTYKIWQATEGERRELLAKYDRITLKLAEYIEDLAGSGEDRSLTPPAVAKRLTEIREAEES